MDEIITSLIAGNADILALVGTHYYPSLSPKADNVSTILPAIIWTITGEEPIMVLSGVTNCTVYHFQIDVYAKRYSQVQQLITLLRAQFSGYSGDNIARMKIIDADQIIEQVGYHQYITVEAKYFS